MNAQAPIDPTTAAAQSAASNPAQSAWVAANAGSGKTFVLSRRVVRLLLAGVDPSRILCLTFTKAAAAEMATRVFRELGEWTRLSDAALTARIIDLDGHAPDAAQMARARQLFARALDTPGGLKIQTIHAFCERLLHQFPFEANIAGHFEVMDELAQAALTVEARRAVLARASAEPDGVLGRALKTVLAQVSDFTHEASIAEFVAKRDQLRAWIQASDSLDQALRELRTRLGLARGDTPETFLRRMAGDAALSREDGRRLVALLRRGGVTDQAAADRLDEYVAAMDADVAALAYLGFYLTEGGEFRASVVTKKTRDAWVGSDLGEILDREAARLEALRDQLRTAELYESTEAMLRLADATINEYEARKRQRGFLDFEDLIVHSVILLSRTEASRWVQYKLDRGIDHVLVDEAQDTSPRQWQVVRALVGDFFSGEGAASKVRTVFAVGDEKQSIFSFQGAVPAWFSRIQSELRKQARDASYAWDDRELHLSFRSVPVILAAVDAVFTPVEAHTGLTAEPRAPGHTARRKGEPGRVIIWPTIKPAPKPETTDWATPLDHLGDESPEVQLAKRLAATIGGWLDRRETLDAPDAEGKPRPIRPGQILILVRSRGALTDAINRQLKTKGVPIAGSDRLSLTEHIAVMDLMALGRVVLTPEDSLSLAALLKSPLVGLDEDALFDLAQDRGRKPLWAALQDKSAIRADFARAKVLIDGWRAMADQRDPHAFYARILAGENGRRAFLARLGPEALDVLDEFIGQTLRFEESNTPSLEGFLAWLEESETEIKRDTDSLRDEVRVMTVHGAKGLEADIVFLVDNGMAVMIAQHDPKLLPLDDEDDPEQPGPMVWNRSVGKMPDDVKSRIDAWRMGQEEEYRRLLYVGMTRARDRLYVVGIDKRTPNDDRRWHAMVTRGLEAELVAGTDETGGAFGEWRPAQRSLAFPAEAMPAEVRPELPEWALRPVPPAPPLLRLTPSTVASAESHAMRRFAGAAGSEDALRRGVLVHRLLQSLPDMPPGGRAAVGTRYLAGAARTMAEGDRAALLAEVLAILDHSGFAEVFAPGSRAEVDIAGSIETAGGTATVSGRIDRLAVTPERVLVVDYKTNRPAPAGLSDVPSAYLAQLALYRLVLRNLYPQRIVSTALLWTDTPALMPVPDDALDAAEMAVLRASSPRSP